MPMYEYRCNQCGAKFEIIRGISAANEEIKCPKCGSEKTEKVLSVVCGGRVGSTKGNLHFPT